MKNDWRDRITYNYKAVSTYSLGTAVYGMGSGLLVGAVCTAFSGSAAALRAAVTLAVLGLVFIGVGFFLALRIELREHAAFRKSEKAS